jgi:signal transduction protein with GAF and PtsI domain
MSTADYASDAVQVRSLEEILGLVQDTGKPAEALARVVNLIAKRFEADVCSVYLLEPDRATLVLAATVGLRPQCIGTLRMALNEGLAGLVAEEVYPIAVERVQNHPRFKHFHEAGEEDYQSFLGVPLIDRGVLQGVLIVQTLQQRVFTGEEVRTLVDMAAQLGPLVSAARTLDRFIAPLQEKLWSLARNLWWSWDPESGCWSRAELLGSVDAARRREG